MPMGSLRKVLPANEVEKIWSIGKTAPTSQLLCSHCRQKMKVVAGAPNGVEIDFCERCHLVWLDTGELTTLHKTNSEVKPDTKTATPNDESKLEFGRLLFQMQQEKDSFLSSLRIEQTSLDFKDSWKYFISVLGMPVEEEKDFFKSTPWATRILIFLCTFVSLWSFKHLDTAIANFSFFNNLKFPENILRVFSASFIHVHYLHLIVNMYALWIFGDTAEGHVGKKKFILIYALSTIVGYLFFALWNPTAHPIVGASAGIAGLTAFYIFSFPHRRFVVFWFFRWLSIPGLLLGSVYYFFQIIHAMLEISKQGNGISYLSHLGGGLVGLFFGWYWSDRRETRD